MNGDQLITDNGTTFGFSNTEAFDFHTGGGNDRLTVQDVSREDLDLVGSWTGD
jgi:hypothetical protein